MKQVTVTITTDKSVNVKITPCKDVLDELLETLDGENGEDGDDVADSKKD